MAQIRNIKIQDIKHKINESKLFSINDFKFEFPNNGDVVAKIIFRGLSKYSFSIKETLVPDKNYSDFLPSSLQSKNMKKAWLTREIPGESKTIESVEHDDVDSCIISIASWLHNLDEDLKFEDIEEIILNNSDIASFEEKLNEKFPDETEKFSSDEKESLLKKLNELQERIEKLEDENSQRQIEILEQSKKELNNYPKKAWYLKIYNKFTNVNNGFMLANSLKDNVMKFLENFGE
jgi:tetrahydromethanopterin S-methyltransferase subunit B